MARRFRFETRAILKSLAADANMARLKRRTLRKFSSPGAKDHHNVYVVLLSPAINRLRKVRAVNPARDSKSRACMWG